MNPSDINSISILLLAFCFLWNSVTIWRVSKGFNQRVSLLEEHK